MSFDLEISSVTASQANGASTNVSNTASADDKDCSVFDSPETKKDFAEVSMSKEELYDYYDKLLYDLECNATREEVVITVKNMLVEDYLGLANGRVVTDENSISALENEISSLLNYLNGSESADDKTKDEKESQEAIDEKYADAIKDLQTLGDEIKNSNNFDEKTKNEIIKELTVSLDMCSKIKELLSGSSLQDLLRLHHYDDDDHTIQESKIHLV